MLVPQCDKYSIYGVLLCKRRKEGFCLQPDNFPPKRYMQAQRQTPSLWQDMMELS